MMNQESHGAPFLSVVVPAYNESKRIRSSLEDLRSFFKAFPAGWEVILVVEKSTDNTVPLAREIVGNEPNFKIIANEVQRGKGYAVRTGMLQARGQFVIFMDLDLSTPLVEVIQFLSYFKDHPQIDVLIGNRQHAKSQILKRQNPLRQKMGQTFNFFVQLFAVKGINDTQCGFKAFRRRAVKPIFNRQKIDGFSFDVEILLLATAMGFRIETLPVKWINSPDSKVRIVRDSIKMFFDLLRMRQLVTTTLRLLPVEKGEI